MKENIQSRRKFIKNSILSLSLATTGLIAHSRQNRVYGRTTGNSPDIAVVEGPPGESITMAFQMLGGIGRFVKANDVVLLKPNISFPNPEIYGSTTSPAVVKAVALEALKAGAKRVIVADHTMRDSELCFKKTGIAAAFEGTDGVNLISLDRESFFTPVAIPEGKAVTSVKVAKLIERSDVVINMPCAKSHVATEVSLGLKNLMGVIWDREFFHSGTDLHTAIAELATVVKPHLTILDATRALVTNGPTGPGKVQELSSLVVGTDLLAVDAYALTLANWNNHSLNVSAVKHLSHAAKLGVGESDLTKLLIEKARV